MALDVVSEADDSAESLTDRAIGALQSVQQHDEQLQPMIDGLQGALAQLQDAAHTLNGYLRHAELDPRRLAELDARMSAWMGLARRYRRPAADLPALLAQWQSEVRALDAATDTAALEQALALAEQHYQVEAQRISIARRQAAPPLAAAVTEAMQTLGMAGGRFDVAIEALPQPQAHGLESVELLVAGHAGSTPRPLAKVASGGELSRLALAIAVTTAAQDKHGPATLIFDEIDAGVGGTVADSVGRLMKQLGGGGKQATQVLAVTHLAQVAACADRHFVVSKSMKGKQTLSAITPVEHEARVAEIARMLGGEKLSGTAHAQALLSQR
jgi:DNA repair protein RecN (Recombination protein N)